jgi:hypothetical protein
VRTEVISDKYLRDILEGRHVFLSDQPITFLIIIRKENFSLGRPQTSFPPLPPEFELHFSRRFNVSINRVVPSQYKTGSRPL